MFKTFKADLHIHTCLSPCGELDMSPQAIVKTGLAKGINIIAITDHNSAENVMAAKQAAKNTGLTVLAGMEITSSEEAHILAIFDDIESVLTLQGKIYANLLPGKNDEQRFGEQVVVNEKDEVLDFNDRLLIGATLLPAHKIVSATHSLGGLSIASHVDKEVFSIVSQLGFIPEDLKFDALEMSSRLGREQAEQMFSAYNSYAWVSSSDAHHLHDVGKRTTCFTMKEPTIKEMALAFRSVDGRKVEWG